jgi:hypothetical protein
MIYGADGLAKSWGNQGGGIWQGDPVLFDICLKQQHALGSKPPAGHKQFELDDTK